MLLKDIFLQANIAISELFNYQITFGGSNEHDGLLKIGNFLANPEKALLEKDGKQVTYSDTEIGAGILAASIFSVYLYKNKKKFIYNSQKKCIPEALLKFIESNSKTAIYYKDNIIIMKDPNSFKQWLNQLADFKIPKVYYIHTAFGKRYRITYENLINNYPIMLVGNISKIHPMSYYITRFINRTNDYEAKAIINAMLKGLWICSGKGLEKEKSVLIL